jgi:hypothetical protein
MQGLARSRLVNPFQSATSVGVEITLGDGVNVIVANEVYDAGPFPYACTLVGWTLLSPLSGSIVLDLRKCTYAQFDNSAHPVAGDSMINTGAGGVKPTLASAAKNQSSTLTNWYTSIQSGDVIRVIVDSATTVKQVAFMLALTRT